jgi:ATP-binding protein involved in chromosome partitioning
MNLFKKNKKTETKNPESAKPRMESHPELKMADAAPASRPAAPQMGMPHQGQPQNILIPNVKSKIAVASGKGGVGKSTVATNLAIALAQDGAQVGLMDADAYGPSIPTMMGAKEQPQTSPEKKLIPIVRHGIKLMSIGFLVPDEQALIWRGPMLHSAVRQFLGDVIWGELDYLIIDLPPGTGDVALSLTQSIPLTGGVIVTTPQDVALADVRRGAAMFDKLGVPILGVVENMSYFACPHCGERTDIFRRDGGAKTSEKLGTRFLGEIPLDAEVCTAGDLGVPIVASHPDSPQSQAFRSVAHQLVEVLSDQDSDDELKII